MYKNLSGKIIIFGILVCFAGEIIAPGIGVVAQKTIYNGAENSKSSQIEIYPTDDATIKQNGPTANEGDTEDLRVRNEFGGYPPPEGDGWAWDILIKFDLSSIPSDCTIKSAKLKLYYFKWWDNDPAGRTLNLYRITSDWSEDTVTWETQPSYYDIKTASATVPSTTGTWMEWNVTADVQKFVQGELPNYGWRIRDDEVPWGDVNIPIAYFYSKEYGDFVPYLEVELICENKPPTVKITYPEYGKRVTGEVTIQGIASDPDGEVLKVEVSVDGGKWMEAEGTNSWSIDYNFSNREGIHEIRARSFDGELYSEEDSVIVIVNDKPFYFIHITDPHVTFFSKDRWCDVIEKIRSYPDPPKFILCTGDLADWGAGSTGILNYLAIRQTLYIKSSYEYYIDPEYRIPVYFCPGNHDARAFYQAAPPYDFSNYYHQIAPYQKSGHQMIINGRCVLLCLTSGWDYWPWGGFPSLRIPGGLVEWPEAQGLLKGQIKWLKQVLDSLDGTKDGRDSSDFIKIIVLHHPPINPYGHNHDYDDGVFWYYRDDFRKLCIDYKVNMVIFGHLHRSGKWDLEGNQWQSGVSSGTQCVVTDAVKDSYAIRKITITPSKEKTEIIVDNVTYVKPSLNLYLYGRCRGSIYDNKGGWAGLNETGEIGLNISGASYSVWAYNNESLGINTTYTEMFVEVNKDIDYKFVIEGLANGPINLTVLTSLTNGNKLVAMYEDVYLYNGSVAVLYANKSEPKYTLIIHDPDGSTRRVGPSGWEGIDLTPPTVKIMQPKNGLYLLNKKIISFFIPLVIGPIDIKINASDNDTGLKYIEIYVDEVLSANITSEPFVWRWDERTFGRHTLKVVAFDNAGNKATDEIIVWKIL